MTAEKLSISSNKYCIKTSVVKCLTPSFVKSVSVRIQSQYPSVSINRETTLWSTITTQSASRRYKLFLNSFLVSINPDMMLLYSVECIVCYKLCLQTLLNSLNVIPLVVSIQIRYSLYLPSLYLSIQIQLRSVSLIT